MQLESNCDALCTEYRCQDLLLLKLGPDYSSSLSHLKNYFTFLTLFTSYIYVSGRTITKTTPYLFAWRRNCLLPPLLFFFFLLLVLCFLRRWMVPVAAAAVVKVEMDGAGGGGCGGEGGGGWSSIYSLSSPSKSPATAADVSWSITKASPPPAAKRAIHGKKNLAICTETLGCETGAVYPVGDFDADTENGHTGRLKEKTVAMRRKRGSKRAGFPPPLTTLSGKSSRRILCKREDGRLRLLLVEPSVVMEAERTDGRLRLRLYSGKRFHSNDEVVKQLENEEVKEEEDREKEEEEEEGGYLGVVGMEMNEMSYGSINGGEEMEIGKFRRAGVCEEEEGGGHGGRASHSKVMLNWEAEVASSS